MKFVTTRGAESAPAHDRLRGAPLGQRDVPAADLWHRDEIPYYGLDIETDTTVDGLDPTQAKVVAVALTMPRSSDGDVVLTGPETQLLEELDRLLLELPPGVLVTWNGAAFDLPFLAERARRAGVPLHLRLAQDPSLADTRRQHTDGRSAYRASWGPHRHLDGYRLYRADVGRNLGLPCGLKPMARLVGLEPVEVDREQIHQLSAQDLHEYVASDARLAQELVVRRLPAAARFADPFVPEDRYGEEP
jgi:DNA polymerase elongation subunit (family B)